MAGQIAPVDVKDRADAQGDHQEAQRKGRKDAAKER